MLVFVAERWLLLVVVPLVIGAATFILTTQSEQTYSATVSMDLPRELAGEASSPVSLLSATLTRRAYLLASSDFSVNVDGGTITLRASAASAESARSAVMGGFNELRQAAEEVVEAQQEYLAQQQVLVER